MRCRAKGGNIGQPVQKFYQSEKNGGCQVGKSIGSSKNGVDRTVSSLRFPEPSPRLQTKRVDSDSGGESCLIIFLDVRENTGIIGKTD